MPRYYFHVCDGRLTFTDDTGVELSGLGAVRAEATRQIRDIKAAQLESGICGPWPDWSVRVIDVRGQTVLAMAFDLKPRPVA